MHSNNCWLWRSLSAIALTCLGFPTVANAASLAPAFGNQLQMQKISGAFFDTNPSRITQMAFGPDNRLYAITQDRGVESFA